MGSILQSSELLFCVWWFHVDVSGIPVCPIFKGKSLQFDLFKMGPRGSPETSLPNYLTSSNNLEDEIIFFTCGVTFQETAMSVSRRNNSRVVTVLCHWRNLHHSTQLPAVLNSVLKRTATCSDRYRLRPGKTLRNEMRTEEDLTSLVQVYYT
jgi:hypothetical protein